MFHIDLRTISGAFITWLIPMSVSFGLYNPATQSYYPNFIGFKIIMATVATCATFFTYRWIASYQPLGWSVAMVYLVVNAAFDMLIIVLLLKIPLAFWLTTILPVYTCKPLPSHRGLSYSPDHLRHRHTD
jgi:hypothetical protein